MSLRRRSSATTPRAGGCARCWRRSRATRAAPASSPIGRRRARRASSRTTSKSCAPIGNRPRRCEPADRARVVAAVRRAIAGADAVVLSDYAKGLCRTARSSRRRWQRRSSSPIPSPATSSLFAGVTCIAPNAAEAARATGDRDRRRRLARTRGAHAARAAGLPLRADHARRSTACRCSARTASRDDVPSVARTVFDVSGAGDTVVAVLTLALAAARPDRRRRRGSRTSPPARWSRSSAPRPRRPAEIVALMEHDAER